MTNEVIRLRVEPAPTGMRKLMAHRFKDDEGPRQQEESRMVRFRRVTL